jgi:uncharacterized protein YjbJ (UPF0337 family)
MSSGKTDEMKGRIKQATGVVLGDEKLEREGKAEKVVGKVKGAAEKVVRKAKAFVKQR